MPYNLSETTRNGKKMFCMKSRKTGKRYCYKSKAARSKAMDLHKRYAGEK